MSEKDPGNTERFAVFFPISVDINDGVLNVDLLGIATDRESAQQGAIKLSDRLGADSWSLQELNPDGSRGKKQFFFSGTTWKAHWQPKGPKPNWRTEANPDEPIN